MQQMCRSGEGFPCNNMIAAPFIFKQELTLVSSARGGPSFIDSQAFATALAQSLTLIMHAKITHALGAPVPHACRRSRPPRMHEPWVWAMG
jgi:hypothetical protein